MNKKIKKYLPSRNILILFFVVLLIIILLIIFKDKINKKNNSRDLSKITLETIKGIGKDSKDTDGDGISDFEEKLNGTDINKRDTDEDGISDLIEKNLGTDPKVKREFDPIVAKKLKKLKENETATDKAVGDFIEKIIVNSNRKLTDEESSEIARTIYKKDIPNIKLKLEYSLKDLKYADQITTEQYKNSFIAAGTILDKNKINIRALVHRYITFPEPVAKLLVNNSLKVLREYKVAVSKMSIPTKAKENHLNYLNSLSAYIESMQGIIDNFKDDPITAMAHFQRMDSYHEAFLNNKIILNKLYFR